MFGSANGAVVAAPFGRCYKRLVKVFLNLLMSGLDCFKKGNGVLSFELEKYQVILFIGLYNWLLMIEDGIMSFPLNE